MFDINAPLERQRSGEDKILHLHDSGLDVSFPVSAWIDGFSIPDCYTRAGEHCAEFGDEQINLHTLPEPLPLIVTFHHVFNERCYGIHHTLEGAVSGVSAGVIAIIRTTFDRNVTDPKIDPSTAKTVWRKGESA